VKKSRAACELSPPGWDVVAPPPSIVVQMRVVGAPSPSPAGRLSAAGDFFTSSETEAPARIPAGVFVGPDGARDGGPVVTLG
jgi:hypothetical protein